MQALKVPGLNFDFFNKLSTKPHAAEPPAAESEPAPVDEAGTHDPGKPSVPDATGAAAEASHTYEYGADVNESLAEHELLWSTQYTYDEFIDSLSVPVEDRGDTPSEKLHWSYPRRWQVKLHNLKIVNCIADSLTCFAEFDFGGSRSECRVQMGGSVCILNKGETKNYIRTPVVQNVTKDASRPFNCTHDFEYRGSYLDLEQEKLKIKLWKYRPYTVNSLESVYEGQLLQFARGDTHVEIPMYKGMNKRRHLRCRMSFDLYFQELYDFELSFLGWRLTDVPSFMDLLYKGNEAVARVRPSNSSASLKSSRRSQMWSTASFSFFDRLKYYFIHRKLERDYHKETDITKDTSDTASDESRVIANDTLDPYALILQGQDELVAKCQPTTEKIGNPPSIQLQIYIRTDSAYRYVTSLSLTSLVSRNSNNAYWENMGEILFRGTLLDLERADIEIDVVDITAPKAVNKVGRVVLPLSGIVDYPYLKSKLHKPKWLSLKASMEGWAAVLDRMNFGSLSGRIQILRKPRYRQLSSPSGLTLYSHPMMLVINISGVDQLIHNDETAELDSYVEVSFNSNTYRTYVCSNNRAPTWNEDLFVPFFTGNTEKISSATLFHRAPIRFTVWGYTKHDKKVVYMGGTVLHVHQIFYTPKGTLKTRVKKTYTDKGGHSLMYDSRVIDTRVFSGPLKLSFPSTEDHQSNITVSAWVYPDIPDDILPDQFDAKNMGSDLSRLLPYHMYNAYPKLLEDWNTVVNLKVKPTFKTIMSVPVQCLTQYKQRVYMPCLISHMHPPVGIYTPNAIFHMIRCIPFVRKGHDANFTPDFLMKLKGGGALDHCILQCSYLRGLIPPVEAYVCVGTTQDGRNHVWTATMLPQLHGSVKFWETTTGETHILKNRVINEACAQETIEERRLKLKTSFKLPYKALLYMFNERNIWINIQGFSDPQLLLYDMDNKDLWYPFSPLNQPVEPCYVPKIAYARMNEYELQRASLELQQNLERYITAHRYAQNLQTRWNKDDALNEFLNKGLKLLHQINTCHDSDLSLAKCELHEWKMLLNKNIPQSHQVIVFPLHFNTIEDMYIADHIKANLPMLDSRERFVTFALASSVISLPANLYSVYVIILVAQKIHERVRIRLVMEKERLAQRKRKKKVECSLDEDPNEILNRDDSLNESLKAALESSLKMAGDNDDPDRQYSSLVDVVSNNLEYQDSALSSLFTRTLTKDPSNSSKENLLKKESTSIEQPEPPSSTNSMEMNKSPVDSGLTSIASYQPEMTINFSKLIATNSNLRPGNKHVEEERISADTSIRKSASDELVKDLMSAPSYVIGMNETDKSSIEPEVRPMASEAAMGSNYSINSNLITRSSLAALDSRNSNLISRNTTMMSKDLQGDSFGDGRIGNAKNGSNLNLSGTAAISPRLKQEFSGSMASRLGSYSSDGDASLVIVPSNLISDVSIQSDYRSRAPVDYATSSFASRVMTRSLHLTQQDTLNSNLTVSHSSVRRHPDASDACSINLDLVSNDYSEFASEAHSSRHTKSDAQVLEKDEAWSYSESVITEGDHQMSNINLISDLEASSLASSARTQHLSPREPSRKSSFNENLVSREPTNVSYVVADSACSALLDSGHADSYQQSEVSHKSDPSFEPTEKVEEPQPPPKPLMRRRSILKTIRNKGHQSINLGLRNRPSTEKPRKILPSHIDNGDLKKLNQEMSASSYYSETEPDEKIDGKDAMRIVPYADTVDLPAPNRRVVLNTAIDPNIASHRLAQSLFNKSKVHFDVWTKPPDQQHGVCDFKYVDLFRGFL